MRVQTSKSDLASASLPASWEMHGHNLDPIKSCLCWWNWKIYSYSSRNRERWCWARIFGIVELNLLRCGALPNTGAEWPDFPKRRSRCSCWCPHQYLAGKGYLPLHLWMLHSRCKYDSNKAKYLKQRVITTGKWITLRVELIGFTLIRNNPILTKMMQ